MNAVFEAMEDMGAEAEETLERLCGDETMYLHYLKDFHKNENLPNLRGAIAAQDNAKALREAHTLKGVALNLGLLPIADPCIEMVRLFRADKQEEAVALLPEIEEQFKLWTEFIAQNC